MALYSAVSVAEYVAKLRVQRRLLLGRHWSGSVCRP